MAFPCLQVVLRSRAGAATLRAQVRGALRSIDPGLAGDPVSFDAILARATRNERRAAYPLALLALSASLVTALGLYGLLDAFFRMRRKELGIRAALGARPLDLGRREFAQGFALAFAGSAAGALGALLLVPLPGRGAGSVAAAMGAAALLLGAATFLACLPPALRALREVPARALRAD